MDLETPVETHSSKVGAAVSKSSVMDGEVAELQADLGGLSAQQLKIDVLRADEREIFATTKEDLPSVPTPAPSCSDGVRTVILSVMWSLCLAVTLFSASLEEP